MGFGDLDMWELGICGFVDLVILFDFGIFGFGEFWIWGFGDLGMWGFGELWIWGLGDLFF